MCCSITDRAKRYFSTPKLATGSGTHAASCVSRCWRFFLGGGGIKRPYVFVAFTGTHVPLLDIISSNCHDVVHWWTLVNKVGTVVTG